MNYKTLASSVRLVPAIVICLLIVIGLSGRNALAEDYNLCGDNDEFTADFLLEDCTFKTTGVNPYFILKPGYQKVLESDEEKSVETVLCETKKINLNGRKIKTRVYEERAYEWDEEEEEWVLIEISKNWFAICKETNAVYYFGEDSLDCEDGFNDDDTCDDPDPTGSWEAGKNGAMPGLMMPGTFLLGSKYFQEWAPPAAVDRGENRAMGLEWPEEGDTEYTDCVLVIDTNPAEGGDACEDDDAKTYCPGVGLVQDEDMELVDSNFDGCDDDDDDDDDDEEEEEED